MDLGIRGKKALVCASSRGMGKAIARALAKEGAELFLCARDQDKLAKTAREIEVESVKPVQYLPCDLTNEESTQGLIAAVQKAFKQVDILVHNVGGPKGTSVQETTSSQWQAGFEQLFQSIVRLNQAFVPAMLEQRFGRIVTVTSLAVLEPISLLAISNAMRSAVTAMMKTLSDELAPFNICVNCVAPGIIHTDRIEERIQAQIAKDGLTHDHHLAEYVKAIPAGRMGSADEFAWVVTFLCSEKASYITGSTICVDGGRRRSTY